MTHLVNTYGYWVVALLVLAEAVGVPLPGETAVITAGVYAGHTHRLSPWVIFVVAAVTAVAGGMVGYTLGRTGGYRLVRRYGETLRIDRRKLLVGRYLFDTYGSMVVFFGRFVSILRTYAAFLAGTNRMDWRRFTLANLAGGVLWAAVFTALAYFVGAAFQSVSGILSLALAAFAAAVIVAVLLVSRRRFSALAERAERAYPDGLE